MLHQSRLGRWRNRRHSTIGCQDASCQHLDWMFVAMTNRVLLSFFVILASVAVYQAERIQRLRSNSEAVGLRNDDIADRRRGDRIDGQQNLFRVEDLSNPREIYREQDDKDETRTEIAGEQQFKQDRRILDQKRSDGRQEPPRENELSRNDRRSYRNEETNKKEQRIHVDEKISPMKKRRSDRNDEIIMESRGIYANNEKLPTRETRRNLDEELLGKGESLKKNVRKRLINESTKERKTYFDDTVAPTQERSLSQEDGPVSKTRSAISDDRQSRAIQEGNSSNEYPVDSRIGQDTRRPSRQRENRVATNDEGRTNRPATRKDKFGDKAGNEKHISHDPQAIQVLRRISLLPDQEESLNHGEHLPSLRKKHRVVKSQLEIKREHSPTQVPKFEGIHLRNNGDSLEAGEGGPHNDRGIRYEARMVSEEIRREKDPNGESRRVEDRRRNRKPQPETYVIKGEELNGRRERIRSNLKKVNDQQRKVPDRSDQFRNYNDELVTTNTVRAPKSNADRSLESKSAQRHIAELGPGKILHDKLQTGGQQKSLIPHADPLYNSIFNLRPLPTVQLSSSKHRTEQPSKNRRVHKEEIVSQSIKVPSFQLKPPGLREPSNHISHSVPFKKTSQRSDKDHRERNPTRPISSSSKNPPSKIIHQSRGSASGRSIKPNRDQSAESGQQVAHVAQKPLSTAATDKGHGKGKKKGKGHHKSHKSSHKKAEGHKGDKGHHEKKGHKKIHKGNYDNKHKKGHHDKGGVFHKEDHHDEHHNGEYEQGKKGIKGYKKGKKMHHHKGHKDKGFKATHHIKEFMVNKKHYEDVDDKEYQGEHDHFDKFFEDFKKGMFKAGSFKGDKHHDKHGKKGHHKKGHHEHHDKGHDKHHGHDGHHAQHEKHAHEKGHHEKHGHDDHGHR